MSWGAYWVSAAVRAPARDAANRLRAWVIGKLRSYDTELREALLERDIALKQRDRHLEQASSLSRQLEIEKDRRESITQDWEWEKSSRLRLERSRDQFEKQVRNRERNVTVKEQQLQRLEEQIQQAYNNGVRDGKFELDELRRMGRQPSRGDQVAKAWEAISEPMNIVDQKARMPIIKPQTNFEAAQEDEKNGRGPTET